ncbi:DICT sensory domain-containing protein [Halosolutus amylolyticus]|uniref:DICT sensory domain-containing protein n=1 Tax=Halosolutus amylolyticus TaxID=2932267 RepID=A0ABD5PT99_9EURY|nr:DICT sensory domain-containing protein [Halosolutus amylolyticus]
MTLSDVFDRLEHPRRTITVYASTPQPDVTAQFEPRGVTVRHCSLPEETTQGFLVIRDADGFAGAIGLEEARDFLEPPVYRPWDEAFVDAQYRTLLEVLDATLWHSLDRRQLLATTREIEDRAWRVGRGTLRVGFQRLSAMRAQLPVYARMADETALGIHVYGSDDWNPPTLPGVTIHTDPSDELAQFWFLAFDGGPDDRQACGLLAEERDSGSFAGFWTYDADLVDEIATRARETAD